MQDNATAPSNLVDYVTSCSLPTPWAQFTMHAFVEHSTGKEHLAMTLGDLSTGEPPLARIHCHLRDVRRGFAHPGADLAHGGRAAAEGGLEVQRLGAIGHQEDRAQFGEGARLAIGGAACAPNEALQSAVQGMRRGGVRGRSLFVCGIVGG